MTVKVLVMKSGEDVIADVQEMVNADQQVIGYFLTRPVVVKLTSNPTIRKNRRNNSSENPQNVRNPHNVRVV